MTKKALKELLLRKTGSDEIVPGYNYTVLTIKTKTPWSFRSNFNGVREEIEKKTGIKFLPTACICRERSVLVPVPFEASLNEVSQAIAESVKNVDFQVPVFG